MVRHQIRLPRRCAELFSIGEPIAAGGFGAVFRATQLSVGRTVALKVLRGDAFGRDDAVTRFKAEARITASLAHPHIVKVLDADIEEDVPWIAYELIEGKPLRARLDEGRQPWQLVTRMMAQVASALSAAHEKDILHRDVKPENVLEAPEGFAHVTDFGIARWRDSGVNTVAGMIIGTPNYLAPEMALGEPATEASDLYALGVMYFELLVGRRPYMAYSVPGILEAHVKAPVPEIDGEMLGIPPDICKVVYRLLAKKASDRPASADALAAALEMSLSAHSSVTGARLMPRLPVEAPAPSVPPRRVSHATRGAPLAVVIALAVATAFALIALAPRTAPTPSPPPLIAGLSETQVATVFTRVAREEDAYQEQNAEYSSVRDLTMSSNRPAHEKAAKVAREQARLLRTRLEALDALALELGPPPAEPREGVTARVARAELDLWRAFHTFRLDRVQQRARMADRSLAQNLDTVGDIPGLMQLELGIQYEQGSLPPLLAAFASVARATPHLAAGPAPARTGALFELLLRLGDQLNPYRFRDPHHAEYTAALIAWERELDRADPTRGFRPGRLAADLFQVGATGTAKRVPVAYARALDALEHAKRALPNAVTGLTLTEASLRRYTR